MVVHLFLEFQHGLQDVSAPHWHQHERNNTHEDQLQHDWEPNPRACRQLCNHLQAPIEGLLPREAYKDSQRSHDTPGAPISDLARRVEVLHRVQDENQTEGCEGHRQCQDGVLASGVRMQDEAATAQDPGDLPLGGEHEAPCKGHSASRLQNEEPPLQVRQNGVKPSMGDELAHAVLYASPALSVRGPYTYGDVPGHGDRQSRKQ
mmetsp:Transcript_41497/g.120070  ORF Transcript_41497/g.120070 Transcript_41497/m.120070 type:complete len:205 (-) Transcript_41497:824-1438(-)